MKLSLRVVGCQHLHSRVKSPELEPQLRLRKGQIMHREVKEGCRGVENKAGEGGEEGAERVVSFQCQAN